MNLSRRYFGDAVISKSYEIHLGYRLACIRYSTGQDQVDAPMAAPQFPDLALQNLASLQLNAPGG
jgi:hypothetical protein